MIAESATTAEAHKLVPFRRISLSIAMIHSSASQTGGQTAKFNQVLFVELVAFTCATFVEFTCAMFQVEFEDGMNQDLLASSSEEYKEAINCSRAVSASALC